MASVINTNTLSMVTQQNLSKSQNDLNTSMERLSSGLRINSAKDDAAGQAIANRMDAQITGLSQAQRNANDGISLAQTAEGALNQINDNLLRVRELTVQAANGTNSDADLDSIQAEIDARIEEIDRISGQTEFNGRAVLAGDDGAATAGGGDLSIAIQVGANDGETITIDIAAVDSSTLNIGDGVGGSQFDVKAEYYGTDGTDATGAGDMLSKLDDAIKNVDSMRSDLGAVQNRFDSAITNLATTETNLASAQSRIQDADYADEVSSMTTAQILQQAGTSMLTQANQVPQNVLSLLG
ncbi:flagellin [Cobetia sp. 3AK]|uniref:flagellin N-terminal helical domain-containing protein n=1 Tax=Cobetia sp. 3AK TaxID=3040020 RepID=UPI00244AEF59|nr:flagellin [Cobetia sp. 3AK]MDH2373680.1 flagellin [Cobetia sp. 3AK]